MVELAVTFLGTSSAAPTKGRGLPAIAVQREGEVVILDCGEGIQRQVIGLGIGLNKDTTILITHLHGDHVTGLLGLIQTMSLAQRTKPLKIVAPGPLYKWLQVTADLLNVGLTFEIEFVPARVGKILSTKAFIIKGARAVHSVEAFSYVLEERSRPGVFHPEKARALGVPEGKLWSRIQRGRKVVIDGRTIWPGEVIGEPRPGRRIGYSGDTRPSGRFPQFFRRCDLLIFDSTFRGDDFEKAVERKHSTCLEAATVAKKARVAKLVLTHFSARYRNVAVMVREARGVFPNTVAASDGLRLTVDYPEGTRRANRSPRRDPQTRS
jgi:ribonuclease Z